MNSSFAAPMPLAPEARLDSVHLGHVTQVLRRRWKLMAGAGLLAFMGSVAFVTLVPPRYTGETKLILESRDSAFTRPSQDRADQPPPIDEQAVASQVQVAMSRDLAREAIRQLGLVGNEEFDPLAGEMSLVRRLMILLGLTKNPLDRPPEDRVLENYYDRLLVYPVGKSRILAIEFRSKDPELAAKAANTIADLYLATQEAAKKDMARNASGWLGANIETLRQRVAEAEAKVEEYRGRAGLLLGTNNVGINAQQLTDLNTQLAQARTAQADSQAKARLIREMIKGGRAFEIPDVANNELIRRLIEQRITLRAQLALEERTLLPQHPRIKELNAQVNDLESQIRGAAERTVRTLENDAKIAGSRVETLQAEIDSQKGVVARANDAEVQLRALDREARAQREQLESYLARYREATARDAENAVPPDARVVSRAVTPDKPSFPKKIPIVLFATLAALVLAAGWIVGRELLAGPSAAAVADEPEDSEEAQAEEPAASIEGEKDTSFDFARAFEAARAAAPSAPALAAPALPAPSPVPAPAMAAPAAAPDRFDVEALIGRLSGEPPENRGRRVLVTGLKRADRAPDLAKALGRALSVRQRAILVSVDAGETPETHSGFTDLVLGETSFADAIVREGQSRLHVVGAGFLAGMLLVEDSRAVDAVMQAFDQTYDWVVCLLHDGADTGLMGLMAPRVDSVVIVSGEDPESPALVDFYERAKAAGAPDVVVAREAEPVEADLVAA